MKTVLGSGINIRADSFARSFYANGGYSLDLSGGVADRAIAHIENCYYIPNVDVRSRICKTHTVSNTAYRVR